MIIKLMNYVDLGEQLIVQGQLEDFGKLLHDAWLEKKSLGSKITNNKIDQLYEFALKNGAIGGKLLGAGGGGFLLMVVKNKEKTKKLLKKNNKSIYYNYIRFYI